MAKKRWLVLAGALVLGILLHFLYNWLPNPFLAMVSVVKESLWEHVKVVFWPLVLAGYLMTGWGGGDVRPAWQLSAILSSVFMLAVGYVYHILLGGEWFVFDIGLYIVSVLLGFLIPGLFWKAGERPAFRTLVRLACFAMGAAVVWFTFSPPEGILFADLSAARTLLTIPV